MLFAPAGQAPCMQQRPAASHPRQQVAALHPGINFAAAPLDARCHVSGIAVNGATGKVAWATASGILHLSSLQEVQRAAADAHQRAQWAAEAHPEGLFPCSSRGATAESVAHGTVSCRPFRVGQRLEDVAWDPSQPCKLAVSDSSPALTLLDFGKVPRTIQRLTAPKHPNCRLGCVR